MAPKTTTSLTGDFQVRVCVLRVWLVIRLQLSCVQNEGVMLSYHRAGLFRFKGDTEFTCQQEPPPPLKIQGRTGSLNPGPDVVPRSAQP